jgi:hypothetical protein
MSVAYPRPPQPRAVASKRLSVCDVMRALNLKNYRRAYELVLSGQLGDVEMCADGQPRYTVSDAAVNAYVARILDAARKPLAI